MLAISVLVLLFPKPDHLKSHSQQNRYFLVITALFFLSTVLEIEVQQVSAISMPVLQFPKPDKKMVSKAWQNISDSIVIPTESIKKRSPSGKLSKYL